MISKAIPHDALSRRNFQRPKILSAFIQLALPPDWAVLIDMDSLRIEKDNYLEDNFTEHFSDISASVKLAGQKSRIYILN